MLRSHRKTVLTAAALMATTALLTSCQDGDSDSKKSTSSAASDSGSGSDAKGKSGNDDEAGSGTEAQADNNAAGKPGGKKVTGTWFGTVSYLAPGKYTVTDLKDTEQQFFTSTDTDIQGAGEICGDAKGQAATPCAEEDLEAASKKGVSATVKLKNGIAVSVVEDHSGSDDGGSDSGKTTGTWSGKLGYMAPGKYSLVDSEGTERAFFTSTETAVNGAGWICGDAAGGTTPCSEEDLEAAAKKGVAVVVKLDNGIAVTIDEEHN
ncbi:hypothetical protein [Streptomyces sp. NPDC046925]|uniref:hypothetical protein n=1 Tax=Streptomyces sp. NPDC046925 TaxID=3155375 RepID=UPI0033E217C9